MPAKPSWHERIDEITRAIEAGGGPLARQHVEAIFAVPRRQAQRILKASGARRVAGIHVAPRAQVLAYVRSRLDAAEWERSRRYRLAAMLAQATETPRMLIEAPIKITGIDLALLPPGITIEAKRITVEFDNSQQALEKLLALAMAMGNSINELQQICG